MRGLLLLLTLVLAACCPAPQAVSGADDLQVVGTETAFVASVLEVRQNDMLVRTETAPQTILSVRPGSVAVGARVYVRGLLTRGGVTRAEVSVLAAHD